MASQLKKGFFQLLTIASVVAMISSPVFADDNDNSVTTTDSAALSDAQVDQVQGIIKDYLLKKPRNLSHHEPRAAKKSNRMNNNKLP